MNHAAFEIRPISTNFTFIAWKNTKFPFLWFEITLTKQLILHKLVQKRKIESDLLLLEANKDRFFIDPKVVAKIIPVIAIITTKKLFRPVPFRSENVKL